MNCWTIVGLAAALSYVGAEWRAADAGIQTHAQPVKAFNRVISCGCNVLLMLQ